MANTFTVRNMEVVGMEPSSTIPQFHGPVAASQTFARGAVLIPSSGQLVVATDNVDAEQIVGFALQGATGLTANTRIPYVPALPGLRIRANASDADGVGYVLLAADIYDTMALGLLSTGTFFLDSAFKRGTTGGGEKLFATIIDVDYDLISGVSTQAAVGDTDARVTAIVTNSAWTAGLSKEPA